MGLFDGISKLFGGQKSGAVKYLEIDESGIELDLNREDHSVALLASIPLKNMQRPVRGRKKEA